MFGSMIARCQRTAAAALRPRAQTKWGAVEQVLREKHLPGQVQLPYGKQAGIVCLDLDKIERRIIAQGHTAYPADGPNTGRLHRWIAPSDRAMFPQLDSIETSEREAR